MNSNFDRPPRGLSALTVAGGILTGIAAIVGLEALGNNLRQTTISSNPTTGKPSEIASVAQLDAASWDLQGTPIPPQRLASTPTFYTVSVIDRLPEEELNIARTAWKYFQTNWNEQTGLVNSVDNFASTTMWDQAAAMAALVSARELDLVAETEFNSKMETSLKSLASLPLYKGELPNKVYNSKTLLPVDYGKLDKREEIGWSALDIGRMALWLKIIGAKYPQFAAQTEAVWRSWKTDRLVKDGQMYGTAIVKGKEQYNQEGRLGYENYAAYGLKLWGLNVGKALDYRAHLAYVNLYGQGVPYDKRDFAGTGANNYVLSEPFILDGIETGFQSLPKPFADRVLAAQTARHAVTKKLTAVTEDNLDRAPYFLYATLFANGSPWATITPSPQEHNQLRFLSTKAAIGWHVLYANDYTQQLFDFVTTKLNSDKGWYNGFYESLNEPNKALTANNNGVILESLLYRKVGKPLTVWAGVDSQP